MDRGTAYFSDSQREQFQDRGYLVLENVLSQHEVEALRKEASRLYDFLLASSKSLNRPSGRLNFTRSAGGGIILRKLQPVNDLSLAFTGVSQDPRILGPLGELMGDQPVLMEEKLNYKQPVEALDESLYPIRPEPDGFPVHSDWAYYKEQNYPQDILSSALCLDDCTAASGPIHVWPGSHKKHLEHELVPTGLQVKPGLVDFEGGLDILAPAGALMIFHALLIHNSRPNQTAKPRRVMIYSHFPKRAGLPHDIRNGPARLREAPYEWEYVRTSL